VGVAEELLRAGGRVSSFHYFTEAGASLERGGAATIEAALNTKQPFLGNPGASPSEIVFDQGNPRRLFVYCAAKKMSINAL
jgi:hypothetical protein